MCLESFTEAGQRFRFYDEDGKPLNQAAGLNVWVNGKPTENILKNNIIIGVEPKQTGMITTDLKGYDIVLTEDVLVTLEWIDSEGEVKPTEALIVSVGLLTGGTYERNSKEAKMKKKLKGMGLGYTMDVRY